MEDESDPLCAEIALNEVILVSGGSFVPATTIYNCPAS